MTSPVHTFALAILSSPLRTSEGCAEFQEEIQRDIGYPYLTEFLENHRPDYFCFYEIYFKGCGLFFPLPEVLVRYLKTLNIAFPQLAPNLLRMVLGIFTVVVEVGYSIGVSELLELISLCCKGCFNKTLNRNTVIKMMKFISITIPICREL